MKNRSQPPKDWPHFLVRVGGIGPKLIREMSPPSFSGSIRREEFTAFDLSARHFANGHRKIIRPPSSNDIVKSFLPYMHIRTLGLQSVSSSANEESSGSITFQSSKWRLLLVCNCRLCTSLNLFNCLSWNVGPIITMCLTCSFRCQGLHLHDELLLQKAI